MNDTTLSTVLGMGASGMICFVIGYAVKKILKILITIVGICLVGLGFLTKWAQDQGLVTITIHWDVVNTYMQSTMTWATAQASNLMTLIGQWTGIAGAGAVGFALGFRKG